MKGDSPCFSRKSDEWETPQDLFDQLNEEFHFELDVCSSDDKRKCAKWFTKSDWGGGLSHPWHKYAKVAFMNPPYSEISKWIKKAYDESQKGVVVVCLIPSRTDTKWWHEYVMEASEIRFIKGRLKFGGSKNSAPFPSCIVIFRNVSRGWWPYICSYKVK